MSRPDHCVLGNCASADNGQAGLVTRNALVSAEPVGRFGMAHSLPGTIPGENKLGLYRQCVGAGKAGNGAKRVCRRIADTACCTEPAMGIQS